MTAGADVEVASSMVPRLELGQARRRSGFIDVERLVAAAEPDGRRHRTRRRGRGAGSR